MRQLFMVLLVSILTISCLTTFPITTIPLKDSDTVLIIDFASHLPRKIVDEETSDFLKLAHANDDVVNKDGNKNFKVYTEIKHAAKLIIKDKNNDIVYDKLTANGSYQIMIKDLLPGEYKITIMEAGVIPLSIEEQITRSYNRQEIATNVEFLTLHPGKATIWKKRIVAVDLHNIVFEDISQEDLNLLSSKFENRYNGYIITE